MANVIGPPLNSLIKSDYFDNQTYANYSTVNSTNKCD